MITIVSVAFRAAVQDGGRLGHLRLGVPRSGAADRAAHAAANALVGNAADAAAIEIVGLPFVARAERNLLVAATGPGARLVVRARPIAGWTCAFARAGDEIRVEGGEPRYAYLAVLGGIDAAVVLGSRSAYPASDIGLAPLRPGDRLATGEARVDPDRAGLAIAARPAYGSGVARVLLGPHDDRVDARAFLASSFTVDERSDRMGVRLAGRAIGVSKGELLTCGMVEGAVQVPRGGQPIVLLADHQTTGGYPVVATVISVDLPVVAQAPVGSPLRFVETTPADAVAALRQARRDLARLFASA